MLHTLAVTFGLDGLWNGMDSSSFSSFDCAANTYARGRYNKKKAISQCRRTDLAVYLPDLLPFQVCYLLGAIVGLRHRTFKPKNEEHVVAVSLFCVEEEIILCFCLR